MRSAYFRAPQAGDVAHIAAHLREADRLELIASRGADVDFADTLARAVLLSSRAWVWATDDAPIGVLGVVPISLLDRLGSPWFLATDEAFKRPRALVIEGRRYIAKMRTMYPNLSNYVDARNDRSVRWLRCLGFTLHPAAPYGPDGMLFHHFTMTRTEPCASPD